MGTLDKIDIKFKNKATVCKYAVPKGYPDNPVIGMPIYVNDSPASLGEYFFASVGLKNGNLVELGSRTLAAVGVGNTISEAEKIAEQKIKTVEGPLFHRKDIGTKKVIEKRIRHMNELR